MSVKTYAKDFVKAVKEANKGDVIFFDEGEKRKGMGDLGIKIGDCLE